MVFRPPLWKRLSASALVAAGVVVLLRFDLGSPGRQAGAWVVVTVLAAAVARYWFLRIKALPDEILLVNWRSRHRVAWAELTRVSCHYGLSITAADGRVLLSSAFRRPGAAAHTAATALETTRRRRQSDLRRLRKAEQRAAARPPER